MSSRWLLEPLEERCLLSTAPQLTAAQVATIIQAAANVSLASQTIVVVDRSGDVLGMYGQDPDNATNLIGDTVDATNPDHVLSSDTTNIENALTENTAAKYAVVQATARARTAAFFESTQDAFTSRTARFIIQPTFPPGVINTEAGPLLGVEFSNALGTDALPPGLTSGIAAGLSGDPGGIPLFINGQPVGAIGVAGDGSDIAAMQSLVPDPNAANGKPAYYSDSSGKFYSGNEESDLDEAVALAGAQEVGIHGGQSFMAPGGIQATQIFVNGLRLPFTAESAATKAPAASALVLTNTGLKPGNTSGLPARTFFVYDPLIGDPTYLSTVLTSVNTNFPSNPADTYGANLITAFGAGHDTIAGVPPGAVYPNNAIIKLNNGKLISVTVDNNNPLADGYGYDASSTPGTPVAQVDDSMIPTAHSGSPTTFAAGAFGFLVSPTAPTPSAPQLTLTNELTIIQNAVSEAQSIRGAIREPADVAAEVYVAITDTSGNILAVVNTADATNFSFDVAVQKARTAAFFSSSNYAFSSRAVGFLADTTLPPAISNGVTGPLDDLQNTLALPQYQGMFDSATSGANPLGNGITIFPGGAPLYEKNNSGQEVLVGAIGVSGDGVDQDDLIAFAGTAGFAAPSNIQDDSLGAGTLKTDLLSIIGTKLPSTFSGISEITSAFGQEFPTIDQLVLSGFDDPDSANFDDSKLGGSNTDKIKITSTDTIITRILERLTAKGVDSVNLPYQKFPRNPGL